MYICHAVLEILAVHPDAQSGKVGTKLVQWGTSLADKKGIEVSVKISAITSHPFNQLRNSRI